MGVLAVGAMVLGLCAGAGSVSAAPVVAAAVVTATSVELVSDPGDDVGNGRSYSYTQANSRIRVTPYRWQNGDGQPLQQDGRSIAFEVGGGGWHGRFTVPDTQARVTVGEYLGATPHDDAVGSPPPHLDVSAGVVCNGSTGSFAVDEITWSGSDITTLDLRFEQRCADREPALRGRIRWRADDPTRPPGPRPVPLDLWRPPAGMPATGNWAYLTSDPWDAVGQNEPSVPDEPDGSKTFTFGALHPGTDVTVAVSRPFDPAQGLSHELAVTLTGPDWLPPGGPLPTATGWTGNLVAPYHQPTFTPGFYPGVGEWPNHNPAFGGERWSPGSGCGGVYGAITGWLAVDHVAYDGGALVALDLRFNQVCGGTLAGAVHWRAPGRADTGYLPLAPPVSYAPVTPARLLDTRPGFPTVDGTARGEGPLQTGETRSVPVLGRGGVPATDVGAVALNLTTVGSTTGGYLTAFPHGMTRPGTSNLNFAVGETAANLVIVPVGADGRIDLYNPAGATDVLVDVQGWVPTGGAFIPIRPARLVDTRPGASTVDGRNAGLGRFYGPGRYGFTVAGRGGVPNWRIRSVVLNVTVTDPAEAGWLAVAPAGQAQPHASSVNFAAGQTTSKLVVVDLGTEEFLPEGAVQLFTSARTLDVVVDVQAWVPTGDLLNAGQLFTGVTPARLLDTRTGAVTIDGRASGSGPVTGGSTVDVPVLGRGGVPATGVRAVIVNITATDPTTGSYLTAYASGAPRPVTSNLNVATGQTVPNAAIVPVGTDGRIAIFNAAGTVQVVTDVYGWVPS
jgi:hypothetical protein